MCTGVIPEHTACAAPREYKRMSGPLIQVTDGCGPPCQYWVEPGSLKEHSPPFEILQSSIDICQTDRHQVFPSSKVLTGTVSGRNNRFPVVSNGSRVNFRK